MQERTHEQGKHEPMCVSVQLVVSIVELAHSVAEDGMWLVVRHVGLKIRWSPFERKDTWLIRTLD